MTAAQPSSPRIGPELVQELAHHLLGQPEQRWLEFKDNNRDPERIGKYISALSNSAALEEMSFGYLVWGIEDGTRRPTGTSFRPEATRRGNQSLEFWLSKALSPAPEFEFIPVQYEGKRLIVLRIAAATTAPVRFNGIAFIRVGDATPELANHPELERRLWNNIHSYRWEEGVARESVTSEEVLGLLDYASYFRLQGRPLPEHRDEILSIFERERLIKKQFGDRWDILNLGAVLFAEDLTEFERLGRKAVRIIRYEGTTKLETIRERVGAFGYAKSFEPMIAVIDAQLPKRERIGRALREVSSPFSELAIRELVANALVHQDMTIQGAGPMVEIFDNRVEITNPGTPLIDPDRFIDHPPRSRNELLAALMRRMNICEERGSGIDKVVSEAERSRLPPPPL